MLKSMTGYGQAAFENEHLRVVIEVKAINAKQAAISLSLPQEFAIHEMAWRNVILAHLGRGKLTLNMTCQHKSKAVPTVHIDQTLFKTYYNTLQALAEEVGAPPQGLFQLALQSPEVITKANQATAPAVDDMLLTEVLQEALQQCDEHRQKEGAVLATELLAYLKTIKKSLDSVDALAPMREEDLRNKLQARVNALASSHSVDVHRLEEELFYYLERLDFTEESVRLAQHLAYFEEVMASSQAVGKKLSFVAQEIGREINTIGAKANHAGIQREVIHMKEELEKIKEQLCNVL